MYLAEDRILSLGIYCQPKSQFYLRYIPNAEAKTDPMKSHEDLMKQQQFVRFSVRVQELLL
jgi:chitin synthase